MRVFVALTLFFLSQSVFAEISESICLNESATLHIHVTTTNEQKYVSWLIKGHNQDPLLQGQGIWTKECESEDAFSSFDENSAIGFKENRAVILLNNDFVLVFNSCISR